MDASIIWFLAFIAFIIIIFVWAQASKRKSFVHLDISTDSNVYGSYEGKYLNGKQITNDKQHKEWYVIYGHSQGLYQTLVNYENDMTRFEKNPDNALSAYHKWMSLYPKYASYTEHYQLYNRYIGSEIFRGTPQQMRIEHMLLLQMKSYLPKIEQCYDHLCSLNLEVESCCKLIYEYMQQTPVGARYRMFSDLSKDHPYDQNIYKKAYQQLVDRGICSDTKQPNGRIGYSMMEMYRFASYTSNKKQLVEERALQIPLTTTFNYSSFDDLLIWRSRYTVNNPINLDRKHYCCKFYSDISDTTYNTSLCFCTCHAFERGIIPCKHMVRLAHELGKLTAF